jgi:hypothetical protein
MARRDARQQAAAKELQEELAVVYTPGAPINDPRLFSGREQLLARLSQRLSEPGLNFILYGERGVGKTSLWQILLNGRRVQRHSASESDDFVSIFLRVLERLGEQFTPEQRRRLTGLSSQLGSDKIGHIGTSEESETSETPIARRQLDLNFVLDKVAERAADLDAVVIDEFQSISAEAVQTQIIEVVKGFSDRRLVLPIFFVGVADSDDALISSPEYPQYKGRHFCAELVPRMSDSEIRDILTVRRKRYNVGFEDEVVDELVRIASGYPVTAHRLALDASRSWVVQQLGDTLVLPIITIALGGLLTGLVTMISEAATTTWRLRKAGVHVTSDNLRSAVDHLVIAFDRDHPAGAQAYEKAMACEQRAVIEQILSLLTGSVRTSMSVDEIAAALNMSAADLETPLATLSPGLVSAENDYKLSVRELRPYIEARRYLSASQR